MGQKVELRLSSKAGSADVVRGRIIGALSAADGLVVTLEPETAPGKRATYHYHYIQSLRPI